MDLLWIALAIAASASPLLTLLHLWQLKEWRIDRLREHLRSEGIVRQIVRVIRPLITLRQPCPVWTQKALTLFGTALLLNLIATFYILHSTFHILFILLPPLQPLILFLSWLLWLPVDHMLKRHILEEARALRAKHPDLTVIGITGSVGKTTTKELLAHILADHHPLVTPAYVNTEIGVAAWLCQEIPKLQSQILIVEMGAYRKGEIKTLCDIVQPTVGVITAIGTQHLGLFGSREAIADAKGELFEALPKNGCAFISDDAPFIDQIVHRATCNVQRVLTAPRFSIALASAVARHLGLSQEKIDQKIQTFIPPSHTFSLREERGITILDDTHNLSPESFHAAITWAKNQSQDYKVLITPGVIELGKEEAAIHEELGKAAVDIFDRIIFLSKHHARMFAKGYEKPLEIYSKNTHPVPVGSLFICLGRMSPDTIKRLLP